MKVSEEIKKVAFDNDINVKEILNEQAMQIKRDVYRKYISAHTGTFLWEHLTEASIVADSNGWEKICSFVGDSVCIMFFDDIEDKSVLIFNNGEELYKLLYEMYGFEFYVTNFETNYLICFNHHDCLLACGTAKKWIESL